jgi:uncharacterized ion transporter superfamily protein YfcC
MQFGDGYYSVMPRTQNSILTWLGMCQMETKDWHPFESERFTMPISVESD